MTTLKPAIEIAARRALAERVDALLHRAAADPLADPLIVDTLAGWLARAVRAADVDAVAPATPDVRALTEATARALGIGPRDDAPPAPGQRVLVVGFDHRDDGSFETAIDAAEAVGARVVGALAVREAGSGRPRVVAPSSGRVISLRTLMPPEPAQPAESA